MTTQQKMNFAIGKTLWMTMLFVTIFNLSCTGLSTTQQNFQKGKICYDKGEYAQAFDLFLAEARKGDAEAEFWVGKCYEQGEGVNENYQSAMEWYMKAAEQGHTLAQYNLAYRYYHENNGLTRKKAFDWYKKAAEQGLAKAQFQLAGMYIQGRGVSKNYQSAVEWYTRSAEQGDANAQLSLARIYYTGQGVNKDYKKAFDWFMKAAKQGNAEAQCVLALMYFGGQGTKADNSEGKAWLIKAAEQGDENAISVLKNFEK